MLLPIYVAARPVQLTLGSRPFLRREFAAGLTRAGFIQLDLRLPPLEPRRLDPRQLATANALSNPVLLIVLALVDAVSVIGSSSLRQASHWDDDGHQRRHY
ncbi:MAG: hypothetical protein ACREA2_10260 [Blastocatellia bacterium]